MSLSASAAEQTASRLIDLIKFPSVNPPGDVRAINDSIAESFTRAGFRVQEFAAEHSKPNLIADYGTGPVSLLFYAHSDVVGVDDRERAIWRFDPFEGHREGDVIYGRGAVDAKSKIAALITAAETVARSGVHPSRTVRIIIEPDGERGDQFGIKAMKAKDESLLRCDCMIACEPSELKILRAYKGRLWMRLLIEGPNVHSLVPDSGNNAIARMIEVLPQVLGTKLSQTASLDGDVEKEMMGGETRCYTQLHSGHALNVSPGSAEASLDFRPVPGQTIEQVVADFQATVDRLAAERPEFSLRLEPLKESYREPAVLARSSLIIRAVSKAYQQALGRPVSFGTGYSVGGMQHFWDLGIPGIYFGSGGIWDAHSANEKVSIAELDEMTRVYAELMRLGLQDALTDGAT